MGVLEGRVLGEPRASKLGSWRKVCVGPCPQSEGPLFGQVLEQNAERMALQPGAEIIQPQLTL